MTSGLTRPPAALGGGKPLVSLVLLSWCCVRRGLDGTRFLRPGCTHGHLKSSVEGPLNYRQEQLSSPRSGGRVPADLLGVSGQPKLPRASMLEPSKTAKPRSTLESLNTLGHSPTPGVSARGRIRCQGIPDQHRARLPPPLSCGESSSSCHRSSSADALFPSVLSVLWCWASMPGGHPPLGYTPAAALLLTHSVASADPTTTCVK